jgi:hypothetical protein
MEFIIAVIAFVIILLVGSRLTRTEAKPSAEVRPARDPVPPDSLSDYRQADRKQGSLPDQAAFERLFSSYTETDWSDALLMSQKRMDVTREEALNRLIRKPSLFAEMLEYARIEQETKRLD